MNLPEVLPAIKTLIGEGNIETALVQLVALLDSDPIYSELAQIARVNQGEFYQIKSQTIRGTIAPDAAQLATNQVTDNALQIVHRLEAGKLTFQDEAPKPTRSQAWRYYAIGGVVTLLGAFLVWRFLYYHPDNCPQFDNKTKFKVMILPFRQTGDKKSSDPAIDIADGLNNLFSHTSNLEGGKADANVAEQYPIDTDYPSLTEATNTAQGCGVQMIVWGKINETSAEGYKLDIRYKLLRGDNTVADGDTTLTNLLKMNDFGNLTRDVDAATRLLYIVLANWANVPIASNLLETASAKMAATDTTQALPDTTVLLAIARSHLIKNENEQAEAIYDQILETYPVQPTARRMRGGLFYQKGDFAAAAADLEVAAPNANTADQSVLKIRAESSVKSGQPAKANQDLKVLREKIPGQKVFLNKLEAAANESTKAIEKQLVTQEQMVSKKPQDTDLHAQAAQSNLALGQPDKALNHARTVIKNDPRSRVGYEVAVEANLQKGDTISAKQILESAKRNGVTVRGIEKWIPSVPSLPKPLIRRKQ